jgi:hypothetical protein
VLGQQVVHHYGIDLTDVRLAVGHEDPDGAGSPHEQEGLVGVGRE